MKPETQQILDQLAAAAGRNPSRSLPLAIALADIEDPEAVVLLFATHGQAGPATISVADLPAFARFLEVPRA